MTKFFWAVLAASMIGSALLISALPGHAYAPADGAILAPPPRPPMVCGIVRGQMKCEVK